MKKALTTCVLILVRIFLVEAADAEIPMHVIPYYDSDGPVVSVGEFSDGLMEREPAKLEMTIAEMRDSMDSLTAEAMYVAAIRLHDLDQWEQSTYWFYSAQLRSRLFVSVLEESEIGSIGAPAFELKQAQNAFFQLAGPYINGRAFCDKESLLASIDRVIEDGKSVPDLESIYPEVSFTSRETWNQQLVEITDGLVQFRHRIETEYSAMKAERDQAGVTQEYCGEE